MPRAPVDDNDRMPLRVRTEDKATLLRAVALMHTDLTAFVLKHTPDGRRCLLAAADVGRVALLVETKNKRVAKWYAAYGAVPVVNTPPIRLLPPPRLPMHYRERTLR